MVSPTGSGTRLTRGRSRALPGAKRPACEQMVRAARGLGLRRLPARQQVRHASAWRAAMARIRDRDAGVPQSVQNRSPSWTLPSHSSHGTTTRMTPKVPAAITGGQAGPPSFCPRAANFAPIALGARSARKAGLLAQTGGLVEARPRSPSRRGRRCLLPDGTGSNACAREGVASVPAPKIRSSRPSRKPPVRPPSPSRRRLASPRAYRADPSRESRERAQSR